MYADTQSPAVVEAVESDQLILRYQRDTADPRTDHGRLFSRPGQALAVLVDTNLLDGGHSAALAACAADEIGRRFRAGDDLTGCFHGGRASINDWLERHGVPPAQRFINVGLVATTGTRLEFTGAYAPIYLCTGTGVERVTFDATVCGFPALDVCATPIGVRHLGRDDRVFVLSDGMLESRTETGKINGDSLLFRFWREQLDGTAATGDPAGEVWRRYLDGDVQRYDSHGMLTVEVAGTAARPVERTLLLLKPDVYDRGLAEEIERELTATGLHIAERLRVSFPPDGVFHLWPRIYGLRWTDGLMRDLPRRPLDVLILEGPGAIDRVIEFKDALRESRAQVNSYKNLLHSPDAPEAFDREYAYLSSITLPSS
jgi:nucleoside diphosphate kinase